MLPCDTEAMTCTRDVKARLFALIIEDGNPKMSLHFHDQAGHMLVQFDWNMVDLMAEEILKLRKERKRTALPVE